MALVPKIAQPGLKWELNRCFEAEPTFTHDPSKEVIIQLARQHLHLNDEGECTADYYSQGALNQIWLIRYPRGASNEQSFIFRVSLPVDPGFKVASDVATMTFVRDSTDTPVPRVLAFDPSHDNKLGFAWTVMEMMPGRTLREHHKSMTMVQKKDLVKSVAEIVAQLFRYKFGGIGNLYQTNKASAGQADDHGTSPALHRGIEKSTESFPDVVQTMHSLLSQDTPVPEYTVGRMVSMSFIWGKRVHFDVYRGPFTNSHDWLAARLTFVALEADAVLNEPAADSDRKVLSHKYGSIARRLRQQLPKFFKKFNGGPHEAISEITTLHHYDTSGNNVMVDEEGKLSALLDWDGVSLVPLWKACQVPEFLMSRYIDEAGDYDGDGQMAGHKGISVVDPAAKDKAIDAEKKQLRNFFLEEMNIIEPHWVRVYERSSKLRDFEVAVQLCDSFAASNVVHEWLHSVEENHEYWSLQERLLEG